MARSGNRPPAARRGFTLTELLIASASAAVLMAGLSSALYISGSVLQAEQNTAARSLEAAEVIADLVRDLRHAQSFSERGRTVVTFTVADRTGDNLPETIRYAWSGTAGDPLTYQCNGGLIESIASDVQAFDLDAIVRQMAPPAGL